MSDPHFVVTIELAGRSWTVRPTFRVVAAAEQAAGLGAYALGARIAGGQAAVYELAAVLHAVLRASQDKRDAPKSVDEVGELLMEDGTAAAIGPLSELLMHAFTGNRSWRERAAAEAAGTDPTTSGG